MTAHELTAEAGRGECSESRALGPGRGSSEGEVLSWEGAEGKGSDGTGCLGWAGARGQENGPVLET